MMPASARSRGAESLFDRFWPCGYAPAVIDLRTLREDPEAVRASQRARGEDVALVDALLSAAERRREAVAAADGLRAEQKQLGKQVGKARGEERDALLARGKDLAAQVRASDRRAHV